MTSSTYRTRREVRAHEPSDVLKRIELVGYDGNGWIDDGRV